MNNTIIYDEKEYRLAFKELSIILQNIPKTEYEKIPKDIIQTIEENAEQQYDFKLNIEKNIKEQNISEITKAILENFYRDYWVTEAERIKIKKEENSERLKIEEEKKKKYNYDDIFKKRSQDNNLPKNELILIKEKWYSKVLNALKKFFNRN